MTQRLKLKLPAHYLKAVRAILLQQVPEYEVWAYGSRVTGGSFQASDLDLALRNPLDPEVPCPQLCKLREAFIESDLPIRVDVVDWARLPESFRRQVERGYVVLQRPINLKRVGACAGTRAHRGSKGNR